MGKLNGDLYDRDNREYFRASLSLFMEEEGGIGEIPAAAYQTFLLLLEHYVDFKMWKRYDEHLGQTVTISYKLATNETWDELEPSQVSSLIEAGVLEARPRQIDSDLDALDPADSEDRLYYATVGLLCNNPAFVRLRDYVHSQPAYQRLKSLDQEFLPAVNTAVKTRHREAMASSNATTWKIGRSLGVLRIAGEVPPGAQPPTWMVNPW